MTNSDLLKGKIRERGLTQQDVAIFLGISPSTVTQKINNIRCFTLSEAFRLSEFLGIDDNCFKDYFFYRPVA